MPHVSNGEPLHNVMTNPIFLLYFSVLPFETHVHERHLPRRVHLLGRDVIINRLRPQNILPSPAEASALSLALSLLDHKSFHEIRPGVARSDERHHRRLIKLAADRAKRGEYSSDSSNNQGNQKAQDELLTVHDA